MTAMIDCRSAHQLRRSLHHHYRPGRSPYARGGSGRWQDMDDDVQAFKPVRTPREDLERQSLLLAHELQAQLESEQQRQQQEREQRDQLLAQRLLEEELEQERKDKEEQEQADIALATLLVDESQQRHQEQDQQQLDTTLALALQMEEEEKSLPSLNTDVSREDVLASLEPCQQRAIHHVRQKAQQMHEEALPSLEARVVALGFTPQDLQRCLTYIQEEAPIIIHLKEETLQQHLVHDTHYRNLFETNTSGGSPNKSKRLHWETSMFGDCYTSNTEAFDRPKYGCLNVTGDIAGVRSARRYGGCFMILKASVRHRATFFDKDTGGFVVNKTLATADYYAHILNEYSDNDLNAAMRVACSSRIGGARSACSVYKEVQIHGPVCLATDVQALCVAGTQGEASQELQEAVQDFQFKADCNVLWQGDLLGF